MNTTHALKRYVLGLLPWLATMAVAGSPVVLTTDDAVALALKNNYEMRMAAQAEAQAEAQLQWSGRLANPELALSYSDDAMGQDENEGSLGLTFTQAFPFGSRLRNEKKLSRLQLDLVRAELAEHRRQLTHRVDTAMIQLALIRGTIAFERELEALNKEIVDFLTIQVERGEASPLELTQTKLTGSILAQEVRAQEAEDRQQTLQIKQLLGLSPETNVRFEKTLNLPEQAPSPDTATNDVYLLRPDYFIALARIAEADGALQVEKSKRWEDLELSLFMERERATDAPEGLERNTLAGVGIAIPLPLLQRNQGAIASAELERETRSLEIEALQFRIRTEYAQAVQVQTDTYDIARQLSGNLLALAESNFAELRAAYESGQASLLQVQQAQEQVLELKSAALAAVANYCTAQSTLRFVTGNFFRLRHSPATTLTPEPESK